MSELKNNKIVSGEVCNHWKIFEVGESPELGEKLSGLTKVETRPNITLSLLFRMLILKFMRVKFMRVK